MKNNLVTRWIVDDPYNTSSQNAHEYETEEEAINILDSICERRANWNHGEGPAWPCAVRKITYYEDYLHQYHDGLIKIEN